jgi:pimeloyl-ACP methyl ester carboxylesterase
VGESNAAAGVAGTATRAADTAVSAVAAAAEAGVAATWRRAGLAGAAIGVLAAGAAAGVALDRLTFSRGMRRRARLALDASAPYGTLRGEPGTAVADDGTELYYEIDEIDATAGAGEADATGGITVVFSHGYCLNQDSWHFQRAALRGRVRMVHWDQRSHGRSARGVAQRGENPAPVTIDRLGLDLRTVLDAAAPEGPLVLVGHSMGGMTTMALAAHDPAYVRERVAGVAFVGTSSGRLAEIDYGLPAFGVNAVRRVLPSVLRTLGRQADLVERGRRATSDLYAGVVERYSFGSRDVDPAVVRFAERLIEATPIDVVAEFYPAFAAYDQTGALPAFLDRPALVLAGDQDMITPSSHSEAVADVLPDAELVLVPGAGHLVMLESPDVVTGHLVDLLARAGADVPGPDARTVGSHERTAPRPGR